MDRVRLPQTLLFSIPRKKLSASQIYYFEVIIFSRFSGASALPMTSRLSPDYVIGKPPEHL